MAAERPRGVLGLQKGIKVSAVFDTKNFATIVTEQSGAPKTPWKLEEIQQSIETLTGCTLPEDLIKQLGFDSLSWQLIDIDKATDAIFVGASRQSSLLRAPHSPTSLGNALGVIWLRTQKEGESIQPRKIKLREIRTSGVTLDDQGTIRFLAASFPYDPVTMDVRCERALVSVSDAELPPPKTETRTDEFRKYEYEAAAASLDILTPHQEDYPGLVTKAMLAQLPGHTHALRLSINRSESDLLEVPFSPVGRFSAYNGDYYPNPGFTLDGADNDATVLRFDPTIQVPGRDGYQHDKSITKLPGWELPLPRQLSYK